jgi:hypothetical protein
MVAVQKARSEGFVVLLDGPGMWTQHFDPCHEGDE